MPLSILTMLQSGVNGEEESLVPFFGGGGGVQKLILWIISFGKGLSTREAGRGHATPHMPVETAKCWWLLKIEPNAWAGGKGSCAVCVDLQAVGALEFFGELCSLAKGFGPIF